MLIGTRSKSSFIHMAAPLALAIGLSGCVPYALFMSDSARLTQRCLGAAEPASIQVRKLEELNYNGHVLGFDRNRREFGIELRALPVQTITYNTSEISVFDFSRLHNAEPTGGSVRVDPVKGKLIVDLQVGNQPFWGNGSYALELEKRNVPCAALAKRPAPASSSPSN